MRQGIRQSYWKTKDEENNSLDLKTRKRGNIEPDFFFSRWDHLFWYKQCSYKLSRLVPSRTRTLKYFCSSCTQSSKVRSRKEWGRPLQWYNSLSLVYQPPVEHHCMGQESYWTGYQQRMYTLIVKFLHSHNNQLILPSWLVDSFGFLNPNQECKCMNDQHDQAISSWFYSAWHQHFSKILICCLFGSITITEQITKDQVALSAWNKWVKALFLLTLISRLEYDSQSWITFVYCWPNVTLAPAPTLPMASCKPRSMRGLGWYGWPIREKFCLVR